MNQSRFISFFLVLLMLSTSSVFALRVYDVSDVRLPAENEIAKRISIYTNQWRDLSDDEKKTRNRAVEIANEALGLSSGNRIGEAVEKYRKAFSLWNDLAEAVPGYAAALYRAEEYAEAVSRLENYLSVYNGRDPNAFRLLALSLFELKEYDRSVQYFYKLAVLTPDDHEVWREIANVYAEGGQMDAAYDQYRTSLKLERNDPLVYLGMGNVLLRQRDYKTAQKIFQTGLKALPGNADLEKGLKRTEALILFQEANTLIRKEKYAEALSILEDVRNRIPGYPPVLHQLATLYYNDNEISKASAVYEQLTRINESDASAWFHLGLISHEQNNSEKALEQLDLAISLAPENYSYMLQKARVLMEKRYFEQAGRTAQEVYQKDPSLFEAQLYMGIAAYENREFKKAESHFNALIEKAGRTKEADLYLGRTRAMIQVEKGNALFDQGKYQESIALYQEALKQVPDFTDAKINLANAHIELAQTDEAISILESLYRNNTNGYVIIESLARAWEKAGNPDQAGIYYSRLQVLQESDASEVNYRLGLNYELNGRYDEAIRSYSEVLKESPNHMKAKKRLAFIYTKQGILSYNAGRFDEAITSLQQALVYDPQNLDVKNRISQIRAYQIIEKALKAFKSKDFYGAIREYTEADKVYPGIPEVSFGIAQSYYELSYNEKDKRQEHFAKAEKYLNITLSFKPEVETYKLLAEIQRKQNRYADASRNLNRAIEMEPGDYELYNAIGYLFYLNNDLKNAKDMYLRALKLNSGFIETHVNLGLAFFKEGDYAAAEKKFLLADRLNPDQDDILFNLGLIYYKENRYKESEQAFRRSIELYEDVPDKYFYLARTYYYMENRINSAIREGERALSMRDAVKYHYGMGKIYEKKMETALQSDIEDYREKAIVAYRHVVKTVPDTQLAKWSQERLSVLLQEVRIVAVFENNGSMSPGVAFESGTLWAGGEDGKIRSYRNGMLQWVYDSGSSTVGEPVLNDGALFVLSENSITLLDKSTGAVIHRTDLPDQAQGSPVFVRNGVLFSTEQGGLYFFGRSGLSEIARAGTEPAGPPLIAGTRVIQATRDGRISVYTETGRILWERKVAAELCAAPVMMDDLIIIGDPEGRLKALALDSGHTVWQYSLCGSVSISPVVNRQTVFAVADNYLYAFDKSGKELWKEAVTGRITSLSGVNSKNKIFTGDEHGAITCFDASGSGYLWHYRLQASLEGTPLLVAGETGYFSSNDGRVYALEFMR